MLGLVGVIFLVAFIIFRLGRLVVCSVALRRELRLSLLRMKLLVGVLRVLWTLVVGQIAIVIRGTHAILTSWGGNSVIRLVLGWWGRGTCLKLLLRIASAVGIGVGITVTTETLLLLSEIGRLLSALLRLLGIVHVRSRLGIVHRGWHSAILLWMLKVVWMRILHRISVLATVRLLGRLVLRLVLFVNGLVGVGLVGSIGVEVLLVTVLTTLLALLTLVVALLVTSLLVASSFSGTIFTGVALCGLGLAIGSVLVATLVALGVLVRFVLLSLIVLLSTIILLVMLLLFIVATLRTHFIVPAWGTITAR